MNIMSTNVNMPSAPVSPPVISGNSHASAGSRESSEFEFVGNNGSGQQSSATLPATLQTEKPDNVAQIPTNVAPSSSAFLAPTTADVLDKSHIPIEDEAMELPSLFGWVKGTGGGILSKVAEKTKSSMETVITTLDPQVTKEHYHSSQSIKARYTEE